ncbi:hypothetical protein RR46_05325 [Papilio xuthus]|uniref:Uncharacterized protein n=1 Tax=Papilio xuthus TaxID=66420 RepID=A0A194Q7U3_PAPXU|nr:hypothetical protein RR46_05325 [Papilio xuthus]
MAWPGGEAGAVELPLRPAPDDGLSGFGGSALPVTTVLDGQTRNVCMSRVASPNPYKRVSFEAVVNQRADGATAASLRNN